MIGRPWYSNYAKVILLVILAFMLAYLLPVKEVWYGRQAYNNLFTLEDDSLFVPLLRSTLFAFITSTCIVTFALILSLLLKGVTLASSHALLLSFLLFPILAGNVSTSFTFKLVLVYFPNAFQNNLTTFFTTGLIEAWQFGSLFIYVFWLNQQVIEENRFQFAKAAGFTLFETIRDILLPAQKGLYLLLYIFCFLTCFYEEAKFGFIFKSSRGNGTEPIGQWLQRLFDSSSYVNPNFAFRVICVAALIILAGAVLGLVVIVSIKFLLFGRLLRTRLAFSFVRPTQNYSPILAWLLVLTVLTPVVITLCSKLVVWHVNVKPMLTPLLLTLAAALLATGLALLYSVAARMVWRKMLSGLNNKSIWFIGILLLLLLIPPLVILLVGFKWMALIAYNSPVVVHVFWMISQVILSFPVLAVFAIAAHFRVRNSTINFCAVHATRSLEKIRDIFWGALRMDYLFLLILAFSTIWNEATINRVFSDTIPSFAVELKKVISGRGTNYTTGIQFLFISFTLSFLNIAIWNKIIRSIQKKGSKNEKIPSL